MRDACIALANHFDINPNILLEAAGYERMSIFGLCWPKMHIHSISMSNNLVMRILGQDTHIGQVVRVGGWFYQASGQQQLPQQLGTLS